MRVLHNSDCHGRLVELQGSFDCVVNTGDFCPNSSHFLTGNKILETEFQINWLRSQASQIKKWLRGKPYLFVLGNHDFISPEIFSTILSENKIENYNLHDKITTFNGVNFYGFPYVNSINGYWNYECNFQDMNDHIEEMTSKINNTYCDVIAAHSPIAGILNEGYGSHELRNMFDYEAIHRDMMPRFYLCGHHHKTFGVTLFRGMVVSNAATVSHILEI